MRARTAAALLTLLLAQLVFLATQEIFGTGAAFLALALLVFDPNLLAHGAVVGTDVGLSCFMFAAIYAFYRYVKIPTSRRLAVVGIATGLALSSKHTGILVFPMLVLLAICELVRKGPDDPEAGIAGLPRGKRALRLVVALLAISAGDLSGFEFGAGALNPYEQFKDLRPGAVIDYGIFVFDGHFEIPLAAAIGHTQKAEALMREKRLPEALAEAQQAVALAPDAVKPNVVLGNVLTALQQPEDARLSYKKALALAKTIEPEFQIGWIPTLEHKLDRKRPTRAANQTGLGQSLVFDGATRLGQVHYAETPCPTHRAVFCLCESRIGA